VGARTVLEEEVVQDIEDQVAGVEDIVAAPGLPHRVRHHGGMAHDDVVVRVAQILEGAEAGGASGRIAAALGAVEQRVDRGASGSGLVGCGISICRRSILRNMVPSLAGCVPTRTPTLQRSTRVFYCIVSNDRQK